MLTRVKIPTAKEMLADIKALESQLKGRGIQFVELQRDGLHPTALQLMKHGRRLEELLSQSSSSNPRPAAHPARIRRAGLKPTPGVHRIDPPKVTGIDLVQAAIEKQLAKQNPQRTTSRSTREPSIGLQRVADHFEKQIRRNAS